MHSIWQERQEFPYYPILKRDKKVDVLFLGATLEHGVEAFFQREQGKSVMIIEKKTISQMPELGGMGILKADDYVGAKDLKKLRIYIEELEIPCDLEVISEKCLWVNPVKLFLYMTREVLIYENTDIIDIRGKRVDVGRAYVDAATIVKAPQKVNPHYVHVFRNQEDIHKCTEVRTYKDVWLGLSEYREISGSESWWEI